MLCTSGPGGTFSRVTSLTIHLETAMKTTTLSAILLMTLASATATSFAAETTWQKNHPRREQVNNRLAHQNARIHKEVKEGDITKGQAAALHREDRSIRREERSMAKLDNGHITKADQRALNQQENVVSKQIGK